MNRILAGISIVAFSFLAAGCGNQPTGTPASGDEGAVRQAFESFQKALKAGDAKTLWSLLDEDSLADAEREAKGLREAYAKANAEERAKQEKELGLAGSRLESLKGIGFLETKRFLGKYDEVPGSKIDKVEVKGDKAVLNSIEEDGDLVKFSLVRQKGEWKLTVPMPTGSPR
jgi:hypothetical protein